MRGELSYCRKNPRVGAAAAQMRLECLPHLRFVRMCVAAQERASRNDDARDAIAALRGTGGDEGALDRLKYRIAGGLNGENLAVSELSSRRRMSETLPRSRRQQQLNSLRHC